MDEVVEALRAEQEALAATVRPLDSGGLTRPSRCPGWRIAEVLLHLAQTGELAVASASGTWSEALAAGPAAMGADTVDDWAGAAVAAEPVADPGAIRERWLRAADAQVAVLGAVEPARRVPWVAGDLAARTLATTRLAETWIHSGDIAWGLGIDQPATDRLWHVARLAHRTLPYAFALAGLEPAGPIAFELASPSGRQWRFGDAGAPTVVEGDAVELCEVAARRRDPAGTDLVGRGPDGAAVLAVVRTFA